MSSVCIVIPVYQDLEKLSPFEIISLTQCLRILPSYPIVLAGPARIRWQAYEAFFKKEEVPFKFKIFGHHFFLGIGGYSRLLLSPKFYRSFINYDYILIHQTDAFVFKDELRAWCDSGVHYIGAPWFGNFSHEDESATLTGVGNGGFSLRNVKAHLRVLHSFSYLSRKKDNWSKRMSTNPRGLRKVRQYIGFALDLVVRNNTFWLLNSFRGFEDQFWSLVAPKNFPWFKIPSTQEAMAFSIEMQPRRMFAMSNGQLPFGCHAWWKYDLEFWKPYIESFGYQLSFSHTTSINH